MLLKVVRILYCLKIGIQELLFEFCGFFVFGVGSALFAEFLYDDFVGRVGFIFACNVVLVFALRTN